VGITSWAGRSCTPALEALALASGHTSRFKVDPNVPENIFVALYVAWIRRSLSGEIADDVLVVEDGGQPVGMVTVVAPADLGGAGHIGLIAVADARRGRGYGKQLIAAAESWSVTHGASTLEVVTQERNTQACALYSAAGYDVIADDAIYHIWVEP
jgi:dTDP-4-amino-4,6-dideoxy-D-galactose acyltransferase